MSTITIHITPTYATIITHDETTKTTTTKITTLSDIVKALAPISEKIERQTHIALLPPNTIVHTKQANKEVTAVYFPAAIHTLQFPEKTFTIPLPPLVFIASHKNGKYRDYTLHAALKKPTHINEQLYHPPLPNIDTISSDGICTGSVELPSPTPENILQIYEIIMHQSYFNFSHHSENKSKHNIPLPKLYETLEGTDEGTDTFPTDILLPSLTLKEAIQYHIKPSTPR